MIAYGRGAKSIVSQILSQTGVEVPVKDIQAGIDGWKNTYPTAWAMLEANQELAVSQGYVEAPLGRRRQFHSTTDEAMIAANKREGGNFAC